jgi:S-adenosylmethionine uptake transporter
MKTPYKNPMPLIRGKSPLEKITALHLLRRTPDTDLKAMIIAFCGFAAFSISDTTSKYLTLSYDPVLIIWGISVFSLIFGIALAPLLGGLKPALQSRHRKIHLARAVCNTIITFLITMGFAHLPLATMYTFIFMTPFFASMMAVPVFKEKIEKRGWIAIIFGFLGVLVIFRPGLEGFNPWFFAPLVASLFIAALFLMARPLKEEDPVLCLSLYPALLNVLLLTVPVMIFYGFPDPADWAFFALAGFFVAGGLTGLGIAFRIGKAAIISPLQYTQILWAIIFGYLIFSDLPDIFTLLGGSIIIASGIYLIRAEHMANHPNA